MSKTQNNNALLFNEIFFRNQHTLFRHIEATKSGGCHKEEEFESSARFPRHWHRLHVTARVSCLVFLPGQCWVWVGTFYFSAAKGQDILTSIPGFWISSCRPRVTIWLWMHTVGLHCWKTVWLGQVKRCNTCVCYNRCIDMYLPLLNTYKLLLENNASLYRWLLRCV